MVANVKNKRSMKTTELKELMQPNKGDIQGSGIVEFYTPEQVVEILRLLDVVEQSEQLVCDHQWKSRFSEKRGSWRLCAKCSKEG